MEPLAQILTSKRPLTLSSAPSGFHPWLMADLARGTKSLAVYIAPDEGAMRAMADTAHYFAPEIEILCFPSWDCLPYDRASPSLRASADRLASLAALQVKAKGPRLLVTTINAITQRTLTVWS